SARIIMEALYEFKGSSGLVSSIPKSTIFFCNVVNHAKNSILNIMPFAEELGIGRTNLCLLLEDFNFVGRLFLLCKFIEIWFSPSRKAWMYARPIADMDTIQPRFQDIVAYLQPIFKKRTAQSIIGRLIFAASSYFIWIEHNNRLLKKIRRPSKEIRDFIMVTVRRKLTSFRFKNKDNVNRIKWKISLEFGIRTGSSKLGLYSFFLRLDGGYCCLEVKQSGLGCFLGNRHYLHATMDDHSSKFGTATFFKKAWDVVGGDITCVVRDFFSNGSFTIFQPYRISDHSPCVLRIPKAQKAIDRNPSCSLLRDEHAHYLLPFKEVSLDEERNAAVSAFVSHYEQFPGLEGTTTLFDDHKLFSRVLSDHKAEFMLREVPDSEIKGALFSMGDDKAPGPYGFTFFVPNVKEVVISKNIRQVCVTGLRGCLPWCEPCPLSVSMFLLPICLVHVLGVLPLTPDLPSACAYC
nr:hypothetical protein [Tanacetum cinerariifolium]